MFNLKNYVMGTLKDMKGYYPDFQIREYSLNWYVKGILTEADLQELDEYLNPPEPEPLPEEMPEMPMEETVPEFVPKDIDTELTVKN